MPLQEGDLVGQYVFHDRWMVDVEMVGVVPAGLTSRGPARNKLNVFRRDEGFALAHAYQQRRGDPAGMPES